MTFDPNGVGLANAGIFGFPYSREEAEVVLLPVCWDVTASYRKGAATGPKAVLEASPQLDFFHPFAEGKMPTVFMEEIQDSQLELNDSLNKGLVDYFKALEEGESTEHFDEIISEVNRLQEEQNKAIEQWGSEVLSSGKVPGIIGGEHSVPLGLIKAVAEKYPNVGILQIDAHADLRIAYEGFKYSHASIMYNALRESNVSKLVQVGIRDLSFDERKLMEEDERIQVFFDWDIKDSMYLGASYREVVDAIVTELPNEVYISFDIDGLHPSLCRNTGTPVPGGFQLEEIRFLFHQLHLRGKRVVGFDLCEVVNAENDIDGMVGARVLWELCALTTF